MTRPAPHPRDITEAGAWLRAGRITSLDLTRRLLARAQASQPDLNAFIAITGERAMCEAAARDAELAASRDRGPLHGIPIVHKDCFDVVGAPTRAGARLYADRSPTADAEVVRRLADAGAVTLGKTLMNELAAGTSGKNVHFGDVRNPWAADRSPGGSSSGTGAALAAGLALGGTGTDAGGSIRVPAACNGVVGLRPTPGLVPLAGCVPRSHTYDTAGPLATTVVDCATLFAVMSGRPPPVEVPGTAVGGALAGVRLGLIDRFSLREVDAAVRSRVEHMLSVARDGGARVETVSIPALSDGPTLDELMEVMLYEFHAIMQPELAARPQARGILGPVVLANLERGARVEPARYRALLARRAAVAAAVDAACAQVDALVTPVLPAPAPRLDDPVEAFDRGRELMLPVSFAGVPALALPWGFDAGGVPVGVQIIGRAGADERLLGLGARLEALPGRPPVDRPVARDQAATTAGR